MLKDTTTPLLLKKEASSQRSFLQCLYEINPDLFAALLAVGLDIFSRVGRVDIECDNGKGARQLTLFLVLLPADYVLCATRNFLLNYGNKKVKKSVDSVEHFIEFSAVLLAITDLMSYKGQVLPFGRSDCAKQLVSFVQIYSATFLLNIPFWLFVRSKKKIEEIEKMIVDKPNLHVLKPFSSWEELDKQLHSLDSRAKGDWFELFCKALLITNRQFNAKAVYLGNEIPPEERTALKLPFHDLGQDGLLIKNDGTRVVFQAKYRSDKPLTHTELSTFFSVAEHADERLLIRTTGLSPQAQKVIDLKDNTYQIDGEYLSELTKEECEKIYAYMTKKSYSETMKGRSSLQDILNCSPGRSLSLNNSNRYSKRGRSQSFRKIGHNFLIAAYKAQSIVSHLFILAIIFKDMVIVSESVETSQHLNKTTLEDRIVKEFPFYKGISFQNYLLFWFVLSLPYFPMVHWELSCGEVFKKIEDLKPVSIKERYVKSVIHRLLNFLTLVAFLFSFCVLGLVIFCEELNIQEISPEDDHIFFGVTLTALTASIGMYRVGQWYSETHKSEGERKNTCCAKRAEDDGTELGSLVRP